MNSSNYITIFTGVFFILSVLFISIPEKAYSGIEFNLGCCISQNGTSECVGCGEFDDNCAVPQDECLLELGGTFFQGGSFCSEGLPGAECFIAGESAGCCVIGPGSCQDAITVSSCGGEVWLVQTSCLDVPQCAQPVSNVPALSTWGIIIVAGMIGMIGLFVLRTRRQTS